MMPIRTHISLTSVPTAAGKQAQIWHWRRDPHSLQSVQMWNSTSEIFVYCFWYRCDLESTRTRNNLHRPPPSAFAAARFTPTPMCTSLALQQTILSRTCPAGGTGRCFGKRLFSGIFAQGKITSDKFQIFWFSNDEVPWQYSQVPTWKWEILKAIWQLSAHRRFSSLMLRQRRQVFAPVLWWHASNNCSSAQICTETEPKVGVDLDWRSFCKVQLPFFQGSGMAVQIQCLLGTTLLDITLHCPWRLRGRTGGFCHKGWQSSWRHMGSLVFFSTLGLSPAGLSAAASQTLADLSDILKCDGGFWDWARLWRKDSQGDTCRFLLDANV